MLRQIKVFSENGIVLELTKTFTKNDAALIKKIFETRLKENCKHINLLVKVENGAVTSLIKFKAFLEGFLWDFLHADKINCCAIVAPVELLNSLFEIECKILSFKKTAFEEKYFEQNQLDEAMKFLKSNRSSFNMD
ncbi:SpoIIAA family protein [Taibaiella soli]|nr:STAS/SEC14 domain-containing protein [Taibaiella soli]